MEKPGGLEMSGSEIIIIIRGKKEKYIIIN